MSFYYLFDMKILSQRISNDHKSQSTGNKSQMTLPWKQNVPVILIEQLKQIV